MIHNVSKLSDLLSAVQSLIARLGPDAPVSRAFFHAGGPMWDYVNGDGGKNGGEEELVDSPSGQYLDGDIMLDWVYIDPATWRIVGDQAERGETAPREGEVSAVRVM